MKLLKFTILTAILLSISTLMLAMSMKSDAEIPVPPEDFSATIVDVDGIMTKGSKIAFDGETFLHGFKGSTEVFIPFERIKNIQLSDNAQVITLEKLEINLHIQLTDSSEFDLHVRSASEITGEASFGTFKIRVDHVKSIEITALVKDET